MRQLQRVLVPHISLSMSKSILLSLSLILINSPHLAAETIDPKNNERIVLIGNGLGERMIDHPYFEIDLHQRFPQQKLYIRNQNVRF